MTTTHDVTTAELSRDHADHQPARPVARRGLLLAGATTAVAAGTIGTAGRAEAVGLGTARTASGTGSRTSVPPATGSQYTANSPSWHLARRATTGATKYWADVITAKGASKWLDEQLSPSLVSDTSYNTLYLRFGGGQSTSIWSVRDQIRSGKINGWEHKQAVQCEHIARLIWSRRQVQAQMTEFWANHINVAALADDVDESRAHYQWTLRTRALGKYADLLLATSLHPAMLSFLGNRYSVHDHPNENQGRELLELHALGVGTYSEDDVLNATRVLTGLSVDNESGEFEYKPWYHWTGPVSVLNWTHANSSQTGGLDVAKSLIGYLARHPATARRVCTKLAQYFVADVPPTSLVDRMASTYLANDTAIAPVLKLMFTSAEFAASHGAVTRRPLESVVATIRTLGLAPEASGYEGMKAIVWSLGDAGHSPINWPTPDGFPLSPNAWSSTSAVLQRWNFTRSLVSNWWPRTLVRPDLLARVCPGAPARLPATHGELVDTASTTLFGRTLATVDRDVVLTFLGVSSTTAVRADSSAVTWRLPEWITLLLNSPYHGYR
ncbi:MAG: DUF1800 domain-containing protein [Angustibacter sp.]